jgi:DNA-binding transcriptional MerR regulator
MREPITGSTAAKIIDCAESTIRLWADQGVLPYLRLPSGIRVYERDDVELLAQRAERRKAKARA